MSQYWKPIDKVYIKGLLKNLVSGWFWTWTPLAGSGFGRSARILGVGGG